MIVNAVSSAETRSQNRQALKGRKIIPPRAAGETPISEMPKSERPWGYGQEWFKSKYVKKCVAGEIYSLNDPESFHFMRAGKNGAIVAEYATYHNDVKFSHPTMEFGNSEAARITKLKK